MPIIISVEGNIGSGKSTIINELKQTCTNIDGMNIVYVEEPVSQWEKIKNKEGKNMIELFYSDQVKYSFSFQMMAYISRLMLLKEAIKNHPESVIITERCLLTDYNIFATMLYEQGKMSEEEYTIYKTWFHYFQTEVVMNAIIYIQCDPEVSHSRCVSRCRQGEQVISLDYLIQCHEKHETWMNNEKLTTLMINNENESEPEQMDNVIFAITDFILDEMSQKKEPINEFYIYMCFIIFFCIFVTLFTK